MTIRLVSAAIVALFMIIFTSSDAMACDSRVENCGTYVPETTYGGGGVQVQTVQATACFTPQVSHDITLTNGYYEFVAALVYSNQRSHERVRAERGQVAQRGQQICWTQNVAPGTHMAVWVTCQTPDGRPYEGWVEARITRAGTYTMDFRPEWNWKPSWLR